MRVLPLLPLLIAFDAAVAHAQSAWPMWGADPRRTHQSTAAGPTSLDPDWTRQVDAGCDVNLNSQPVLDADGNVYVAGWGILRTDGGLDRTSWPKSDGHLFGFRGDLSEALWEPLDPALVPLCYDYDDRDQAGGYCPGLQVNGYNGTIEGFAAFTDEGLLVMGRGDGNLYAVDVESGTVAWQFTTFNPQNPDDPEGGGEIVTPPLIHEGIVYFATWAPSEIANAAFESNALYGVDIQSEGEQFWRYPSDAWSLTEQFLAAPALSPDGAAIYFGSFRDARNQVTAPAHLYAVDPTAGFDADDGARLLWTRETTDPGVPSSTILVDRVVVGRDGTLFLGGTRLEDPGDDGPFENPRAVVLALDQNGDAVWNQAIELGQAFDGDLVLGLSLREVDGVPSVLYAGQGFNNGLGGALTAIDVVAEDTSWTWRAAEHDVQGQINDPTIDAAGNLFFGVRGAPGDIGGWVVALDEGSGELWRYAIDHAVEWSPPALGADGTLYFGDRSIEVATLLPQPPGECPPGHTPRLHAIFSRDPDLPVADEEPDGGGPGDGPAGDEPADGAGDAAATDGGTDGQPPDAGGHENGDEGCGCRSAASPSSAITLWVGLALALAARRRPMNA